MSQSDSAAQSAPNEPPFFPEFCFMASAEIQEFNQLIVGYARQFDPQGALQKTVFENLVHAAWELVRCRRMEGALGAAFQSYTDLMNDDKIQRKMDWIARRKGQFERSFNRSLKEMKALKAEQIKQQPPEPELAELSPEQLTAEAESIIARRESEISERTQFEAGRASQIPLDYEETEIIEAA